jgi:hypothetical protein
MTGNLSGERSKKIRRLLKSLFGATSTDRKSVV